MKIDRVHIDGFGDHGATSLPAFETPVTILYGPNEAGKSTLLAFIRMVLFGFPLRGAADHFPPTAGGSHGGRIDLVTDRHERFTVERHRGKKGGPVTITAADGAPAPGAALGTLVTLPYTMFLCMGCMCMRAWRSQLPGPFHLSASRPRQWIG